jgi:hypothetical protein
MTKTSQLNIFFAYSREDSDLRTRLDKHLSSLKRNESVKTWFDGEIEPGKEWEKNIFYALETSDIILLLISADFISSDYCYNIEMKKAIQRHEKGEAIVIPIILKPCDWSDTPFSKLQALPKDATPVMDKKWDTEDQAMMNVALGIRSVVSRKFKEREKSLVNYFQEITALKEEKERAEKELQYLHIKLKELEEKIQKNSESELSKKLNESEALTGKQEKIINELRNALNKYERLENKTSLKTKIIKAKITNEGRVYSTLNKTEGENWANEEIKSKAGANEWKKTGFYPKKDMVGEVIDNFNHTGNGNLIYVLKIDDYYVPIGSEGIKLEE